MFASGIGMYLWSKTFESPITLLAAYPGYLLMADQYFIVFLTGVLFAGLGCRLPVCVLLIYQLKKQLESKN